MFVRYASSLIVAGWTTISLVANAYGGTPIAGTLDLTTSINQGVTPTVDTCTAAGWSRDPNNTGATWVDFYANAPFGQPGSIYVGGTIANLFRGDLPFADKNHGFVIQNNLGAGVSVGSVSSAGSPSTITISSNTFTGNAAGTGTGPFAAIWIVNATNGTMSGNTVTDNANGILVDGVSTSWNINSNSVSSTPPQHLQQSGIWIRGSQVSVIQVTGNTVQRNGGSVSVQIIIDSTVPPGAVNSDWSTANTIGWW